MLEPIKRTRLYESVAKQIKTLIKNGTLKVGDQLPSERELAERLNVSRTSIREALRALEMAGYLESRVGVSGGTFVKETSIEQIVEPFTIALVRHKNFILDILEVRMILENEIAKLAAQRRTEEDLKLISDSLEFMKKEVAEGKIGLEGDNVFHESVAKATHNSVLLKVMDMWRNLTSDTRRATLELPGQPQKTLEDHKKIFEAIKEANPTKAAEAMRVHLTKAIKNVEAGNKKNAHLG